MPLLHWMRDFHVQAREQNWDLQQVGESPEITPLWLEESLLETDYGRQVIA